MNLLGWCRGIEDAAMLKTHGYDYIECTLASLQLENQEEYRKQLSRYLESPLPVKAFNVFFPGGIKVVGPTADALRIRKYVAAAAEALHTIGAKIAVLGSGGARNVPEGWERERAQDQLLQLLGWIADEFAGTGVTLAIEPLNTKESNIINSVTEAASYAKLVNRLPIRILADFYHMDEEQESYDTLLDNREWLAHIHVADTGRLSPGTGQYPYKLFTERLREAGYQGMISAECRVDDPDRELPASLAFLKRELNR